MLDSVGVTAIYTTHFQRTVKTAEPLAKRLGLEVTRDDQPVAELMRQIRERHPKGTVLVVGHSNTLPDLLTALGVQDPRRDCRRRLRQSLHRRAPTTGQCRRW